MEVYALVGASGTGKSHHATDLADELQISYIIDDGLLIHNGKKLAGVSAKSEPTMVAAVKRAIFLDQEHASNVKTALSIYHVKKLLILGTSEHMIDRIVGALGLPAVKQVIYIQDVATEEEIATAKEMRKEGKHVIPLPVVEVRKDLVVISENVFIELTRKVAERQAIFGPNPRITVRMSDLGATIQMESRVKYGVAIQRDVMAFQKNLSEEVEKTTGIPVRTIDVRLSGVMQ